MKQMNLTVTPEFERDLRTYMKRKGLKTKSDAVRMAVSEVARRWKAPETDFRSWLGAALKAPLHKKPQFTSEDELWS